MSERKSRRIVRQWDREIDDELRRERAARDAAKGPWRRIVWAALWLVWLVLFVALLAQVKGLR